MHHRLTMSRRHALARGTALAGAALLPAVSTPAEAASEDILQPYGLPISLGFPFDRKTIEIDGARIAYVDEGEGQPVLFLHGNPTSSYLWRNVIPYMTGSYRAIAPDLIGMGDSGKPAIGYTLEDHVRFMEGFIDGLGLEDIILVVHDWGSVIGMRHARLNPDNVAALAFMEAIVPLPNGWKHLFDKMSKCGETKR